MENILIVGSQGYIGTVLCAELIKKKINIIGVDNFIYSQKKIKARSSSIFIYGQSLVLQKVQRNKYKFKL